MEKSRLLIVEADDTSRKTISVRLSNAGYDCVDTPSTEEALEILKSQWIDAVLLDACLPQGRAMALLRAARSLPGAGLVPIIMMTTPGLGIEEEAITAGADDFLMKPFSKTILLARVDTLTRLNRYRRLSDLQGHFDSLLTMAPFGWLLIDNNLNILRSNRHLESMVHPKATHPSAPFLGLFQAKDHNLILDWLKDSERQPHQGLEVTLLGHGLTEIPILLQSDTYLSPKHVQYQILFQDLSPQRQREALQFRTSFLDALTGLPNRKLLTKLVDEVVLAGEPTPESCPGLILIDLDHFHRFNVSFGLGFGDDLLRAVTNLLEEILGGSNVLARVGADEFVVFVSNPGPISRLESLVDRVRGALKTPILVGRTKVHVRATFGLAHGWDDGETMLRYVHSAVSEAKVRLRGSALTYTHRMGDRAEGFTTIAGDQLRAMGAGEFYVEYQPIVSLKTWEVLGFEALLRWRHQQLGLISPAEFIPVAEETGFIVELGNFVIDQACNDLATWIKASPNGARLSVNVNVSPLQLGDDVRTSFQERVSTLLSSSGLKPSDLKLEITESAVVQGSGGPSHFFRQMKQAGVRIQVDDFGTGYSCLSYLTRLPLDALKIDRSFVSRFNTKKADAEVVKAIVNLGVGLGLETVAEGVETLEQAKFLRELGCSLAQGYLFAKPMGGLQVLPFLLERGGNLNPGSLS